MHQSIDSLGAGFNHTKNYIVDTTAEKKKDEPKSTLVDCVGLYHVVYSCLLKRAKETQLKAHALHHTQHTPKHTDINI